MQVYSVIVAATVGQVQPAGSPGAFDVNGTAPQTGTVAPGGTTGTGLPAGGTPAPSGGFGPLMWVLPGMLLVMILMSTMTGRKEKKKRAALMNSMQRGDKVQMLGGIIGVVHELSDDEMVLNVETGRIRFARTAVQTILKSKNGGSGAMGKSDSIAEAKPDGKVVTV